GDLARRVAGVGAAEPERAALEAGLDGGGGERRPGDGGREGAGAAGAGAAVAVAAGEGEEGRAEEGEGGRAESHGRRGGFTPTSPTRPRLRHPRRRGFSRAAPGALRPRAPSPARGGRPGRGCAPRAS